MLSVLKNLRNNKKNQVWWSSEIKIWEVKEFIRIKKPSFKKQKLYPNEENKKDHKLCQIKCKTIIRETKKKSLRNSWLEQSKIILNCSSSTSEQKACQAICGAQWQPGWVLKRGQGYCRKAEWILASLLVVEETEDISSLAFLEGNTTEDPSET